MDSGDVAQIITALAAVGAMVNSMRNTRKLDKVENQTNGLVAIMGAAREEKGRKEGQEAAKA